MPAIRRQRGRAWLNRGQNVQVRQFGEQHLRLYAVLGGSSRAQTVQEARLAGRTLVRRSRVEVGPLRRRFDINFPSFDTPAASTAFDITRKV
jgi:hypothetical protein